jgi:uncharacterized RDD family membrane protein YckC
VSDLGGHSPYPVQDQPQRQGSFPPPTGRASGPRAGFGTRLLALIVDILVLLIPNVILIVAVEQVLANLLSALLSIAYYTYFEGGPRGQTPGKRAMGIRVIDFSAGGSIGYGRALVRTLGRYVSGIPLGLGYFWMLWDKEKQTWHDKFANSVVVPIEAYPVPSDV